MSLFLFFSVPTFPGQLFLHTSRKEACCFSSQRDLGWGSLFVTRRVFGVFSWPMSNEQVRAPGCLGYIEENVLSKYVGIIINHEIRIPSLNNQYFMESKAVFFLSNVSGASLWSNFFAACYESEVVMKSEVPRIHSLEVCFPQRLVKIIDLGKTPIDFRYKGKGHTHTHTLGVSRNWLQIQFHDHSFTKRSL